MDSVDDTVETLHQTRNTADEHFSKISSGLRHNYSTSDQTLKSPMYALVICTDLILMFLIATSKHAIARRYIYRF